MLVTRTKRIPGDFSQRNLFQIRIIIIKQGQEKKSQYIATSIPSSLFLFLDIDECGTNIDECAVEASCFNTNGSYNCSCNDGYSGNGKVCVGEYNTIHQ